MTCTCVHLSRAVCVCVCAGAEVKSLGSSGVTHLVVASELDPVDIPVVSSRVTVVKVQVRRERGHLVLEPHWME